MFFALGGLRGLKGVQVRSSGAGGVPSEGARGVHGGPWRAHGALLFVFLEPFYSVFIVFLDLRWLGLVLMAQAGVGGSRASLVGPRGALGGPGRSRI